MLLFSKDAFHFNRSDSKDIHNVTKNNILNKCCLYSSKNLEKYLVSTKILSSTAVFNINKKCFFSKSAN